MIYPFVKAIGVFHCPDATFHFSNNDVNDCATNPNTCYSMAPRPIPRIPAAASTTLTPGELGQHGPCQRQ